MNQQSSQMRALLNQCLAYYASYALYTMHQKSTALLTAVFFLTTPNSRGSAKQVLVVNDLMLTPQNQSNNFSCA